MRIGLVVLALAMAASVVTTAQRGYRAGYGNRPAGGYSCCAYLPGLTGKQEAEITKLERQHRKEMDEMRAAWRQSGSYASREEHLAAVGKKVADHRNAVRNLLNDEQKEVFDHYGSGRGRFAAGAGGRGMGRGAAGAAWGRGGGRSGYRGGRF